MIVNVDMKCLQLKQTENVVRCNPCFSFEGKLILILHIRFIIFFSFFLCNCAVLKGKQFTKFEIKLGSMESLQ